MLLSLSARADELIWHTLPYIKHSLHERLLERSRSGAGPVVERALSRRARPWLA
jgi:hypothetical protein